MITAGIVLPFCSSNSKWCSHKEHKFFLTDNCLKVEEMGMHIQSNLLKYNVNVFEVFKGFCHFSATKKQLLHSIIGVSYYEYIMLFVVHIAQWIVLCLLYYIIDFLQFVLKFLGPQQWKIQTIIHSRIRHCLATFQPIWSDTAR